MPTLFIARANYRLLAEALKRGKVILVQGSAQRVSKMRKRLSELVGEEVVSVLAELEGEKVYVLARKRDLLEEGGEGGGAEEAG